MTGYWRNDKKDPDRIQYKKFLHQVHYFIILPLAKAIKHSCGIKV